MLATDNRLTDKKDVDRVFRRGQAVSGRDILVKHLGSPAGQTRAAFLVGKKLAKKANRRNRIRRRLRESVRLQPDLLPRGRDLLIIARDPKLFDKPFVDILQTVAKTLRKIA